MECDDKKEDLTLLPFHESMLLGQRSEWGSSPLKEGHQK